MRLCFPNTLLPPCLEPLFLRAACVMGNALFDATAVVTQTPSLTERLECSRVVCSTWQALLPWLVYKMNGSTTHGWRWLHIPPTGLRAWARLEVQYAVALLCLPTAPSAQATEHGWVTKLVKTCTAQDAEDSHGETENGGADKAAYVASRVSTSVMMMSALLEALHRLDDAPPRSLPVQHRAHIRNMAVAMRDALVETLSGPSGAAAESPADPRTRQQREWSAWVVLPALHWVEALPRPARTGAGGDESGTGSNALASVLWPEGVPKWPAAQEERQKRLTHAEEQLAWK